MEKNERLRDARKAAGFATAADAARAHGWNPTAYRHHENGTAGFDRVAERYARAFRVTPEWLVFGRGDAPELQEPQQLGRIFPATGRIPILGTVEAGVWREAQNWEQLAEDEDLDTIPIAVPGYDQATLFALQVRGPSMDLHYPDGRFVVAAPPAEVGVRDGDHVIVRRNRSGLTETTVKEIHHEDGRIALWPRSTDPAHQQPFYIVGQDGDQDAPEVIGVVVADFATRRRGREMINIPRGAIK